MYRSRLDERSGTGGLVTVRRYLDPVAAQMARARLSVEGIEAHVIEAASFNPMLSGIAGGTQLQVREGDVDRAEALLHEDPGEGILDDEEGRDAVRCPRCELTYCFHERTRFEGSGPVAPLAILAAPLMLFLRKRWHCHKCGHVWDDPKEGPSAMTRLDDDDPRPVFRLRRAHGGMGLFLGLMAGCFMPLLSRWVLPSGEVAAALSMLFFFGGPVIGWLIGRSMHHDVCSAPDCRTPLPPACDDCPRCKGAIAGVVRTAEEHFSAAADFRRELAALHLKDKAAKKKKKKAPRKENAATSRSEAEADGG